MAGLAPVAEGGIGKIFAPPPQLTEQAQAWAKGNRDPGDLYRGLRLLQAAESVAPRTPRS